MKEISRKRISNRRYPVRFCEKPDCIEEFIPTDARQKYCCPQHRIDFNNDNRKKTESIDTYFIKIVKENSLISAKVVSSSFYKSNNHVTKFILDYEGYNFEIYHYMRINIKTNNQIFFCHNFGLELVDLKQQIYIIHKQQ